MVAARAPGLPPPPPPSSSSSSPPPSSSSPSPAALLALELALELDLQLEGWSGRSPGLGAGLELEQHEGAMELNLTGPATWLE